MKMDKQTVYLPSEQVRPTLYIRNLTELQVARRQVKRKVKAEEQVLKDRLQELPGQLLYTGFKYVIPPLLSGRITNTALEAGKSLVDLFFIKKDDPETASGSVLSKSLKKAGMLTALKWGFRLLTRAI
jgi:hypothetical protein